MNSETVDRVLRAAVGLALVCLAFVGPETTWGWLGLVPLLTALDGYAQPDRRPVHAPPGPVNG